MKVREGDLLHLAEDGAFDVIVHGCNCFHTMGAGIARAIAARFPAALEADRATPHAARSKLGTYSHADVTVAAGPLTIVNAYTQYRWGGRGRQADYEAIDGAFAAIARDFATRRIGYPLIGAGLAGGDWDVIEGIIRRRLDGLDHTLVRWTG
ncbi:macro domain-containing protein [Jannaschia aquimarina]|uniref:Macro domain protein n=1 Tax=Jannaschia aquimarina TaxID=935700 RepID=A0A0D1EF42_9RHOB|nr:macro domain-containing protein [Jannaschia aquimarina]KIT14535.1 Macro domain protein [Jannaschia aquimarina]SNT35563.1 O-acetyl-ADP-ribose deacetylase (regulator of RNase III), contains Macro domain [Jannaschia aquimarina]